MSTTMGRKKLSDAAIKARLAEIQAEVTRITKTPFRQRTAAQLRRLQSLRPLRSGYKRRLSTGSFGA